MPNVTVEREEMAKGGDDSFIGPNYTEYLIYYYTAGHNYDDDDHITLVTGD